MISVGATLDIVGGIALFNSGETITATAISIGSGGTLTGTDNIDAIAGGSFAMTGGTLSGTGSTTIPSGGNRFVLIHVNEDA